MWYRNARKNVMAFGGGVLDAPPVKRNPDATTWDVLVEAPDHIGNHKGEPVMDSDGNSGMNEGPATQSSEMRRVSPHHQNPEFTTWEEQLEAVRHQNVNVDPPQSMSATEGARGEMLIRGIPQYNQGKGWRGFNDKLPSDQSFAL